MTTDALIARIKAEGDAQVVATVNGRRVTRGELSAAFDKVRNPEHWKRPIDANVELGDEEIALVQEAIVFFTGSQATLYPLLGTGSAPGRCRYRVVADGYFMTIGA
jgi:hypothetical protein